MDPKNNTSSERIRQGVSAHLPSCMVMLAGARQVSTNRADQARRNAEDGKSLLRKSAVRSLTGNVPSENRVILGNVPSINQEGSPRWEARKGLGVPEAYPHRLDYEVKGEWK